MAIVGWRTGRRCLPLAVLLSAALAGCDDGKSGPTTMIGTGGAGGSASTGGSGTGGSAGLSGSGGVPGASHPGFEWTVTGNDHVMGQTLAESWYSEDVQPGAPSFGLSIGGYTSSGMLCSFVGRFLALPPPAGTYSIVAWNAGGPLGSFTFGGCYDYQVTGGQLVITTSAPNDLEGTFTMNVTVPSADPSQVMFTGSFAVSCEYNQTCPVVPSP